MQVEVEPFWPGLFAKSLQGVNAKELITTIAGGMAAGGGAAIAAGAAAAAPAEAAAEAPKGLNLSLII